MTDFRDNPTEPGTRTRPVTGDDARTREPVSTGDGDRWEHERIGVHNEAETIRRDRIRWGPIWAGIVTAVGSYLLLQLALIATGITEIDAAAGDDAIASGIAALIAFFLGGLVTGATAMWQGLDDGVVHGIVMWFAAMVGIIVFSAVGSGVALGSFDTADVFDDVSVDEVEQASDDAQEAAGWALLALGLALAAAAAGGAAGAKLWPRDDVFVDVVRRRDGR
jgi:hypothetical protein